MNEPSAPSGESKRARRRRLKPAAERKPITEDAFNVPNMLTFARIVAIVPFCADLAQDTRRDGVIAALIFTVAAITDFFDGYLARRMGVVSVLGKFLDPLADKLIVMASLVGCVHLGRISPWFVAVLLGRELSVSGLRAIASSEGVVIAAGQDGKTKTALQMIGIICLVAAYPVRLDYGYLDFGVVNLVRVGRFMLYVSLAFSVAAMAQYLALFAAAVDAKVSKRGS